MYQLASTLGIDSHRYALKEKNEADQNNKFVDNEINIGDCKIESKLGLTTFCSECNKENKTYKINLNQATDILQCQHVIIKY